MITVYGIRNCGVCRKALEWLSAQDIKHRFHDLRGDGLDGAALEGWIAALGWERLLNRRGTTWRKLPAAVRDDVSAQSARDLMLDHPTLIKRPVFDAGGNFLVGFSDAERDALAGGNPPHPVSSDTS